LRQDFGRIRREMGRQPMVATIHSIGEGRPAEVPLSDRREERRRLITILDRLWREADAASKPPARLREMIAERDAGEPPEAA
jgi:hypothetical protein